MDNLVNTQGTADKNVHNQEKTKIQVEQELTERRTQLEEFEDEPRWRTWWIEKKIKTLETDLAQMQEDLNASNRQLELDDEPQQTENQKQEDDQLYTKNEVMQKMHDEQIRSEMLERQNRELKVKLEEVKNSNRAKVRAAIVALELILNHYFYN